MLIDPAFETDRILERVRRRGCRLTHVINTHGHADHTAGNTDVIRATGALLYTCKPFNEGSGAL